MLDEKREGISAMITHCFLLPKWKC